GPAGWRTSRTRTDSRTNSPRGSAHWPSARQTVSPSGNRGVISSARNAAHAPSVTRPPPGIARPNKSRTAVIALAAAGEPGARTGAGAFAMTGEQEVVARARVTPAAQIKIEWRMAVKSIRGAGGLVVRGSLAPTRPGARPSRRPGRLSIALSR